MRQRQKAPPGEVSGLRKFSPSQETSMGTAASTKITNLQQRPRSGSCSTWSGTKKTSRFSSIISFPSMHSLIPKRDGAEPPLISIDRRPEYQKQEDRQNLAFRAVKAEQERDEMKKQLDVRTWQLDAMKKELDKQYEWRGSVTNLNTIPQPISLPNSEIVSQLEEKDTEIEDLIKRLEETQNARDRAEASDAVKEIKIVELQKEIDGYQRRVTSLEEICRNQADEDSLVSVSPTFDHLMVPERRSSQGIKPSTSIDSLMPKKSNLRAVSAYGRRPSSKSPNDDVKIRPSSEQPNHFRKNIVMIDHPRRFKNLEERIRSSDDSDADIRELLSTPIRPARSASATSKDSGLESSADGRTRPRRGAFEWNK